MYSFFLLIGIHKSYHDSVVEFRKNLSGLLENFCGAFSGFSAQPMDVFVPAEPGQLPLGIVAGGLLDLVSGFLQGAMSSQMV